MSNILEARGLCKSYGSFVLDDVNFSLPSGYIMGFVGPNGAGKTTTIKLILGVVTGDAGSVRLFGRESDDFQSEGIQNEDIGVVMDTLPYVDDWSVADVETALAPFYGKWDTEVFSDHLRRFGLERKKKVRELSRGMKVKLQIAVALSHDARLLILDEPTSGLDPVARDEICDLLRAFVSDERKSVLFSTHITTDLEKTADYITFILDGSIVFAGTKDALLERYARVTGGVHDVDGEQRELIIGYREYGTGFEGMIEAAPARQLPDGVLTEEISLDEIIIFMNREARADG